MNLSKVECVKVVDFLREYRALECSCCSIIIGFQNKVNGMIVCVGAGCIKQSPTSTPNYEDLSSASFVGSINPSNSTLSYSVANPLKTLRRPVTIAPSPLVTANAETFATIAANSGNDNPIGIKGIQPNPLKKEGMEKHIPVVKVVCEEKQKPVERASKVSFPTFNCAPMWTHLVYSKNLTCANAQVRINFAWSPLSFAVSADHDETVIVEMQKAIKVYAAKARSLEHPPLVDQIVLSMYEGIFYRARVMKMDGETCVIEFIDFGDRKECKIEALLPVDKNIMKYPVYGMTVRLARVPSLLPQGFKMSEELEETLYEESFVMDQMLKGIYPSPLIGSSYEVRLWDMTREGTLNEKLTTAITAACHNE